MKKPSTPFPVAGYYGPSYFCDREEETKTLLDSIRGGRPAVLTAQRRMGKTALLMHVIEKLPSDTVGIYLDILATENMSGLLNELATAVVGTVPGKKGIGRRIWDFITTMRPAVTFDNLTGSPQLSFSLKEQEVNKHIESIFSFLESQKEKFVIAIDEFQQILNYPEKNADSWFRTVIQRLKSVTFIFCGSQQHLLNEMFTIPSKPFYRSAGLIRISHIDREKYTAFIVKKFSKEKRSFEPGVTEQIMDWTDVHTYYVQLLCNRIYLSGAERITEKIWKAEAYKLLLEQETIFYNYRGMLTTPQWQLLKAAAKEGVLFEPTGAEFISRYALGSPATVLRSLQSLLRMELIYYDFTPDGRKYYKIHDLLFRRWIGE